MICNIAAGNMLSIQSEKQQFALGGVEIRKTYAVFGYGVVGNLEAFLRVRSS